MTDKQYPELPEPTAWRTYDNLLKRARYNAMPITSMQPGIYSHTRMFTEDQMRAFADATCAMRANNMFLKERAKLNQEWAPLMEYVQRRHRHSAMSTRTPASFSRMWNRAAKTMKAIG